MTEDIIELRNLAFTYAGKSNPALRDLNLSFQKGSFSLITGLSGCGKSTLAHALCGFIPHGWPGVMEGEVWLDGLNTRHTPPERLAGIVGLVQQDPDAQICSFTVSQEVAFGLENLQIPSIEIKFKIKRVLAMLGIAHLADREVTNLSGGEKQRLALASILAMEPKVLVLDEPSAHLDPEGILGLVANLETLKNQFGYTVIVIEHRIEPFYELADRMLVLAEGCLVADDSPSKAIPLYRKGLDKALTKSLQLRKDLAVDNPREPLLEVEGMVVRRAGIPVLQNVSFRLQPGEIMAVMGANGCGKTSLLLALLGHHPLEKGSVSYRGQDISHLDIQERVKEFGMVLQNPGHQILERSVWQETLLAAEMLNPNRTFTVEAESLLQEFSLQNYRNNSPFLLSMGEKKRLCAVSALVYEPDLLLLDEPLAGQDAGHLDLLMQHLYRHCQRGGSVLMVCHHPEVVASYCHRLLFLEGGQVGYEDWPDKVFQWLKERGKHAYLPLREGDYGS